MVLGLTLLLPSCYAGDYSLASWYGNESIVPKWKGYTKNGEKFDENKLTCALPTKEGLNRYYKVTNLRNGKSVIVWGNDTGNLRKYGRAIDLSKKAFSQIADLSEGVIKVTISQTCENRRGK